MAPEEGHTTQDVPISAPSILPPSIPPPDTVPDTSTEPGVAAVDRDIAIHGAQFFSEDPVSRDIAYHCAQFFFEDPAAAYARCRQYLSNHRPVCQYTSNHPQYPSAPAIEKALYLEGWGITDKVSREMGPGARRDPLEGSRIPHSQEKVCALFYFSDNFFTTCFPGQTRLILLPHILAHITARTSKMHVAPNKSFF
jgi:hypothetical protein